MPRFVVYLTEEWQRRVDVEIETKDEARGKAETAVLNSTGEADGQAWFDFVQFETFKVQEWSHDRHGLWAGEESDDG